MSPRSTIAASSLLLLAMAAAATGQGQVIPASLTGLHGLGTSAIPFGSAGPIRAQCIYDAAETGVGAPVTILSLQFRADENRLLTAKSGILLQVEMSTTPFTNATFTGTFAANRGGDHRVVYNRKVFAAPLVPPATPGALVAPIVLDSPYTYDPAQGNLLIEFDIANQPAGAYDLDHTTAGYGGYHSNVGNACNGLSANSSAGGLGGNLIFNVSGGPNAGIGFFLLGYSLLTPALPVPGNPGCSVYQNLPVITVATLNGSGNGTLGLQVPADRNLRLVTVYGQFAIFNATLTNVNTTQTRAVILGDRYECGSLVATSNTAATGSIQRFVAPVIRLNF
jgi:hypothetical protein